MRTPFIFCLLQTFFLTHCCLLPRLHAVTTGKPNVVIILADDLGYGDVGCYGATKIKTPNIDNLAREGRIFNFAYTPGSVCSPSRYGLMSGRYFWREPRHPPTVVLAPGAPLCFDQNRFTLAKLFQENGYATAAIGKWHLGFGVGNSPPKKDDWNLVRYDWSQEEIRPGPLEVGFDYFYGMAANVSSSPRIYIDNHRFVGRKPGDEMKMMGADDVEPWSLDAEYKPERVAGEITEEAVKFIERTKDKPFFLYFASNLPHEPITPSADFSGKSECGPYGDFVQELDSNVGEIIFALKKTGMLENTLIIFTSDNGGVVANNGNPTEQWQAKQCGHLICGDLRGRKHSVYEGGFRVPFIVRWPGQIPAGTKSNTMLCLTDVLASCAAMLGKELPEHAGEDSFNALPAWMGDDNYIVRDTLILDSANGTFAVRAGDWKLIERNPSLDVSQFIIVPASENENQLFNIVSDPGETRNVWSEYPEVVKRLTEVLAKARKENLTNPGQYVNGQAPRDAELIYSVTDRKLH